MVRLLSSFRSDLPDLSDFSIEIGVNPNDGLDFSRPDRLNIQHINETGLLIWEAAESITDILGSHDL